MEGLSWVRAVAMSTTDGLARGLDVDDDVRAGFGKSTRQRINGAERAGLQVARYDTAGWTDDAGLFAAPARPLGEALHYLRMDGAFYCRSEFTAPFGLELPPLEGYLWFHVITSGSCWLEAPEAQPQRLEPGDLH